MDTKIEITLGAYKGVQVKKQEIAVTEEELAAELRRACEIAAKNDEKTDGAAEAGDQAVIDYTGYIDGEAFPGGTGMEYPLVLGSGTFIPGFEEQLIGAHKGDRVDVKVTFPQDYHAPEYAGKEAVFKVAVRRIQTTVVPELSDEVVAKVSACKTVPEFTEYVKQEIRRKKMADAAIAKENMIMDQIIQDSEIHVPEELIEERAQMLKQNLVAQLRNSGNTFEQYLRYNGINEEVYRRLARQDALTMLKGQAVLAEIARLEGFSYTEEELNAEVAGMARAYQMEEAQLRQMMGEQGVALLAEDIVSKKALEFLAEQAVEV